MPHVPVRTHLSPFLFGDPKTDEGPLGLASVFHQERRSAGSDVNSMNVGGETASGFFIGCVNGNAFQRRR